MSCTRNLTCALPTCGTPFTAENNRINRAQRIQAPLYCSRTCAGVGRRLSQPPSEAEARAAKRLYDLQYRTTRADLLKSKKAAYFQHIKVRDAAKYLAQRQARQPAHNAYCRQPAYRVKKQAYDLRHRAERQYGPFAEAALVLRALEKEIASRATKEERAAFKGTVNKSQHRRGAL